MSTMLYGAELLPITAVQKKKAGSYVRYHKFQRQIVGISWKNKVSNERVRAQTQLEKINLIIKERRLRWLGLLMDDNRLPRQAVHWYKESLKDRERIGQTSSSSFLACNSRLRSAIILHRVRFWAKSAASGSVRWCCCRSCWTVLSHVMRGQPGCLLQSTGGRLTGSSWHLRCHPCT